ncbi:hypothetical protein BAUCODRAFT_316869 [Baudoinia panamericana UAMH 10762]|uniref:Uncharacterized protein n=1 Tax=Baudoinia panamericana (strain UAMH 10762) TaxID=717646 RepID=M2MWZ9_BAUPA|nr:uncharacterized protein BAUCODRAFT_316869 [Baudoinia panamericana UAMH 10762]EMC91159.1 hypothetical protein BAUCODRAFT_316869 [Baudoinia panamericana UAMH 10762]
MCSFSRLRPIHLFLDWDGTLTVKDTMSLLAKLPEARDRRLERMPGPHPSRLTVNKQQVWKDFTEAYMNDYKNHKASCFPGSDCTGNEYSSWLNSLLPIEYASAQRVTNSGFFQAVRTEDLVAVVSSALETGELQLRKGWEAIFELYSRTHASTPPSSHVSIVSVNWSETLIRSSLDIASSRGKFTSQLMRARVQALTNHITISTNEIHGLNSPDGSSGRLTSNVRTSGEKLARMVEILRDAGRRSTRSAIGDSPSPPLVVYVGDSATDYECLMRADVGIWVCDCPDVERNARFKATFHPLNVASITKLSPATCHGTENWAWCYWAPDLEAVAEWLASMTNAAFYTNPDNRKVQNN